MDLISKRDALDKVHKTIESLILRLPRVRGVDGEDYCTDPASLAAYNMAYEQIRREIQGIPSWHTEDPEENREYFVTWQASLNGHTFRKIGILEWDYDHWVIEDWMRESYEDISVVAWMQLPEEYVEDWK